MHYQKFIQNKKVAKSYGKFYYLGFLIIVFWLIIIIILIVPRHLSINEEGMISKEANHYFFTKKSNLDPFKASQIYIKVNFYNLKFTADGKFIYQNNLNQTKKYEITNDRWISSIYNFNKMCLDKKMYFVISNNHYYLLITNFFYKLKNRDNKLY